MKLRVGLSILAMMGMTSQIAGCLNGVKASDYSRSTVGSLVQVEPAVIVSQRYVTLSSWWPFGLGPGAPIRSQGDLVAQQRRGISYVVRLDKTGETLAVVQADDIRMATGGQVWVEFGARLRVAPR
jgi:outer membrane lipoprotein SlyB